MTVEVLKNITVTINQILSLVPKFKRQVLGKLIEEEVLGDVPKVSQIEAQDVDYKVFKFTV